MDYPTFRIYCLVMGVTVWSLHFSIHHSNITSKSHVLWGRDLFLGWIAFLQMILLCLACSFYCSIWAKLAWHWAWRTCSSLHLWRKSIRSVVRFSFCLRQKDSLTWYGSFIALLDMLWSMIKWQMCYISAWKAWNFKLKSKEFLWFLSHSSISVRGEMAWGVHLHVRSRMKK